MLIAASAFYGLWSMWDFYFDDYNNTSDVIGTNALICLVSRNRKRKYLNRYKSNDYGLHLGYISFFPCRRLEFACLGLFSSFSLLFCTFMVKVNQSANPMSANGTSRFLDIALKKSNWNLALHTLRMLLCL